MRPKSIILGHAENGLHVRTLYSYERQAGVRYGEMFPLPYFHPVIVMELPGNYHEVNWTTRELARGPLAFCPDYMDCYSCGHEALCNDLPHQTDSSGFPYVTRAVIALGPVIIPTDPTQSFRLSCQHLGF
jgi:hypothetical protein